MKDLLKQIEDAYVATVPAAINRMATSEKLAAVFIPYFAWEAEPEDHAENGQQLYLLSESYFSKFGDDLEERSYAFSWPQVCEESAQPINDENLRDLLLQWYTYQNDNDVTLGEEILLAQIGQAVTAACRRLNALKWPSEKFTDDFAVYSQCMADDSTDYGIAASVTPEWLAKMKAKGLFQTWIT